ncbi:carboxymuconolactone decarboxylase family protein [Thermodesulfobacteriota bacterium]
MEEKTKILISIGASTAANCVPCLEHYYGKAREAGLSSREIEEAAETGVKVKRGAELLLRKSIADLTAGEVSNASLCCGSSEPSCCD